MRPFAPVALVLLLAPTLSGCLGGTEPAQADVLASFYPLAFLAQRISGDNLTVATLVGPGIEPHDWEPSLKDLRRVSESDVLLVQGLGFEPWLDAVKAALPEGEDTVFVTTRDLPPQAASVEGSTLDERFGSDPHTWLDPVLFERQARNVEAALAARWPEHASSFAQRREALSTELLGLHAAYAEGLASCEVGFIIANHDAYGYPATRYGFEVEAINGLSPEAEPDARTIRHLTELAKEHNVTVIFYEELVSPRVARVIADEVGATTRVLSPIEGLGDEERARGADYVSLMRANLAGLREAMRCA